MASAITACAVLVIAGYVVIVAMQPGQYVVTRSATISASRDRILGTVIGALLGFAFAQIGVLPWNYVLAVLTAVIVCGLLGLRSSSRLAGITISIVMLVKTGSHWTLALDRVMEVFLGVVVAIAVSTLVFPDRARLRLRDGLAQEFLVLGAFFEAILKGFRGTPHENLPALREDVLAALRSNSQLLEASRNEPSGGPGWREGLEMLAQFGRSLFDALIALEFSVKDSREDGYAQQLEPALGRLAVDTRTGFHHVAGCIHVPVQFRGHNVANPLGRGRRYVGRVVDHESHVVLVVHAVGHVVVHKEVRQPAPRGNRGGRPRCSTHCVPQEIIPHFFINRLSGQVLPPADTGSSPSRSQPPNTTAPDS